MIENERTEKVVYINGMQCFSGLRSRFENFHIPRDSCFKILSFRTYEVQLVACQPFCPRKWISSLVYVLSFALRFYEI
jgi:hypothetical protein